MYARAFAVLGIGIIAGGCGLLRSGSGSPAAATSASAQLRNVNGASVGSVSFSQTTRGILVTGSVTGLGSGTHGMHVHAVGRCEPPFESAGPHFEPGGRQHGYRNPQGPHAGDLPNLSLPTTGTLTFDLLLPDASLGGDNGLLDEDGAALVIHVAADDYVTDPSGNSGARIACGVIVGR